MTNSEQKHLDEVYTFIEAEIPRLEKLIAQIEQEARETKTDIAHETRLNFDSLADNVDTFANIESGNRQIDALNSRIDTARSKHQKATILAPQVYFARVDLAFDEDDVETFYLGKVGYSDSSEDSVVYDWRTPLADVYYSGAQGSTSYIANGRRIEVQLTLRRQFDIDHDTLRAEYETTTAMNDPVLLQVLAAPHTGTLQDITTTIQSEQNAVIRDLTSNVLIVDGVAGSGKTSVLLQRIAYLRYVHRSEWRPEEFMFLTPSTVFAQYVKDVLPALGETNPVAITFAAFISQVAKRFAITLEPDWNTTAADLATIEAGLHNVVPDSKLKVLKNTPVTQPLIDRLQLMWRRLSATEQIPDDVVALIPWPKLGAEFGMTTVPTMKQILYMLLRITNYHQDNIKALFVDEAQDYDLDQVYLVRALFNGTITFVGDHNQTISANNFDYQTLPALFTEPGRHARTVKLTTSYRSTGAITRYFGQFDGEPNVSLIKPVQAAGTEPEVLAVADTNQLTQLIQQLIRATGTVAVITPSAEIVPVIATQLAALNAAIAVVTDRSRIKPAADVQVMPLSIAKGLEFDTVVVVDFAGTYFTDPVLGSHRRYVAASRATSRLIVIDQLI